VAHKKKEVKVKRMIMDATKHHLISHVYERNTVKEMFDAMVGLYESENINKKMISRNSSRRISQWYLAFLPTQFLGMHGKWTMAHLVI
jgi:hypothetical protein